MINHKPHIKTLACFNQVAEVIGNSKAQLELWKVVHSDFLFHYDSVLGGAFIWKDTPQKDKFWRDIYKGINPYLESKQDE